MSKNKREPNFKISVDCYGGVSVEAPSKKAALDLLHEVTGVKKKRPIDEALR